MMIDPELKKAIDYNFKQIENELEKRSQEEIDKRLNPPMVLNIKPFTDAEIEHLKNLMAEQPTGFIIPYKEPVIKHLKVKKDIPTVIEYQGRRYILDDSRNRK